MKKLCLLVCLLVSTTVISQGVSINSDGSNPDNSSILDVKSTSKGILIPRMLQSERSSIVTPSNGLLVYQTNGTSGFYFYDGSSWVRLATGTESLYTEGTGIDITSNIVTNTSPDQTVTLTSGGATTITGTYPNFTISSTDDNSGGTLTSVTAGSGLNGGTITASGTISMPNVGTAGTYGSSTQTPVFTTDDQGRVTGVVNTTISGVAPSAGSSNYIQNGTIQQTSANYNIDGNGTLGGDININGSDINGPGISGGSNGILRVNSNTDIRMVLDKDANGTQQFDITPNGTAIPVFTVTEAGNVTTNGYVRMLEAGATPTLYTTLQSGDLSSNVTLTLPTSTGTASQFMQTDGSGNLSFYTLGGNIMSFYSGTLTSTSVTSVYAGAQTVFYNMPGGAFAAEATTQVKMPKCQVTRMRIVFSANTLNSSSTIALRKNGVATAISITQAAATTTTSESTGTIAFADGDLLSVRGVLGGTSGQTFGVVRIEITYYLVP